MLDGTEPIECGEVISTGRMTGLELEQPSQLTDHDRWLARLTYRAAALQGLLAAGSPQTPAFIIDHAIQIADAMMGHEQ
jgi:hypothetical protein